MSASKSSRILSVTKAKHMGRWWPRGEDGWELFGVLEITPEQVKLELMGSFRSGDLSMFDEDESDLEYIVGVTSDNKLVVLEGCTYIGGNESLPVTRPLSPAFPLSRYAASGVFLSENSRDVVDLSLTAHKVYASFNYLPNWLRGRAVKTEMDVDDDGGLTSYTATLAKATFPSIDLDDVQLTFRQGFSTAGDKINRHEIKPLYWSIFSATTAMPLTRWLQEYVGPLENFLTLATGKTNQVLEISISHLDNTRPLHPPIGTRTHQEVLFKYTNRQIADNQSHKIPPLPDWESPFLFRDVRERVQDVIASWYRAQSEIPAVLSLLASVEQAPGQYVENQFLSIARAIEVFHRVRMEGGVLPKPDFQAKLQRILDAVEEDERQWLRERLGHANDPSLKIRVQELFDSIPEFTSKYPIDGAKFARIVATNRNRLALHIQNLKVEPR